MIAWLLLTLALGTEPVPPGARISTPQEAFDFFRALEIDELQSRKLHDPEADRDGDPEHHLTVRLRGEPRRQRDQ